MNWLVYHLVSGESYFTGGICCICGMLLGSSSNKNVAKYSILVWSIGAILVVLSATPIPLTGLYLLITSYWVWYVLKSMAGYQQLGLWLVNVVLLGLMVTELRFHLIPQLPQNNYKSLVVMGDSLSADEAGLSTSWPDLIKHDQGINIQNNSFPGDTLKKSNSRLNNVAQNADVVLIELGGNDILGETTTKQFDQELDHLLGRLAKSHSVLMFELPLPPFCQEYGHIQRKLAARHHVQLIPKRVLLTVIAEEGATVDSLHLSQSGHNKLAREVWSIIEPLFNAD